MTEEPPSPFRPVIAIDLLGIADSLDAQKAEIKRLKEQNRTYDARIAAFKQIAEKAKRIVGRQLGRIRELQTQITDNPHTKGLQLSVSALQQERGDLQARIKTYEAQQATYESTLRESETAIADLTTQLTLRQQRIGALETTVKELEDGFIREIELTKTLQQRIADKDSTEAYALELVGKLDEAAKQLQGIQQRERDYFERALRAEEQLSRLEKHIDASRLEVLSPQELLVLYLRRTCDSAYKTAADLYDQVFPTGIDEDVARALTGDERGFILTEELQQRCIRAGLHYSELNLEELIAEAEERAGDFEQSDYFAQHVDAYTGAKVLLKEKETQGTLSPVLEAGMEDRRQLIHHFEEEQDQWRKLQKYSQDILETIVDRRDLYTLAKDEAETLLQREKQGDIKVPLVLYVTKNKDQITTQFILPTDVDTKERGLTRALWAYLGSALSPLIGGMKQITAYDIYDVQDAKVMSITFSKPESYATQTTLIKPLLDAHEQSPLRKIGIALDMKLVEDIDHEHS